MAGRKVDSTGRNVDVTTGGRRPNAIGGWDAPAKPVDQVVPDQPTGAREPQQTPAQPTYKGYPTQKQRLGQFGRLSETSKRLQALASESKNVPVPESMYPSGWVEQSDSERSGRKTASHPALASLETAKSEPQPKPARAAKPKAPEQIAAQQAPKAETAGTAPKAALEDFSDNFPAEAVRTESMLSVEPEWARAERAEKIRQAEAEAKATAVQVTPEPAPMVTAQENTLVTPNPRKTPPPLSNKRVRESFKQQKAVVKRALESATGSAIEQPIEGDPDLDFREVSVPVEFIWRAYQNSSSRFRAFLGQDLAMADPNLMLDPDYAFPRIIEFLKRNDIEVYTEKRPVVDEASAHRRILRAHTGSMSILVNPLVAGKYNADFDGDAMKMSIDLEATEGAKDALDFLIGTEGAGKIDPGFFGIVLNGKNMDEVKEMLHVVFDSSPIVLSERGLNGMAKAILTSTLGDPDVKGSKPDPDSGFRSLMLWCRSEGEAHGAQASAVTSQIITMLYENNKMIRLMEAAAADALDWDSDGLPQAGEVAQAPPFTSTLAPFPHLIAEASLPANDLDVAQMFGESKGRVDKNNPPFRRISDKVREGKKRPDLFGTPRSADGTLPFGDLYAKVLNGVDHIDRSVRRISGEARRLILVNMGLPDISSPEAFMAWLDKFSAFHNRVVYTYNSIAARMKLDLTLLPNTDLSLPSIPEGDTKESRHAKRRQYAEVFGGVKMSVQFGPFAPRGYRNVTLTEFIRTHNLRDTGLNTTPFNSVSNFIMRLADLRTSYARDFRNLLLTDDGKHGALVSMMTEDGKRTRFWDMAARRARLDAQSTPAISLDQDVEVYTRALYTLSPEIFEFVGLTSPRALATDELGKKLVGSKSADQLGGRLYEALARWRLDPILRYEAMRDEAESGKKRSKYQRKYEHELASLASSSPTWATLVALHESGFDIFDTMLFADLTMSQKDTKILELVTDPRNPVGRPTMEAYEVASELFAHPTGQYATSRWSSNLGHTTQRANIKMAQKIVDNYARSSWDHCATQVEKARIKHQAAGNLTKALDIIAADERILNPVPVWAMVDGTFSILEQSQKSAEKPKQEDEVSYLYSATCGLYNGAVTSDLEVAGDLAFGKAAMDRFQQRPMYLAKILSDRDFSITVYAGGKRRRLNRAVLFDGNPDPEESEIWDWLTGHPRAAMALRQHSMTNSVDPKSGFSIATAVASLEDTISRVIVEKKDPLYEDNVVLREMCDHPGFHAMVALATEITGMKRSQLRTPGVETYYAVVELLRGLSTDDDSEVDTLKYVRGIALKAFGAKRLAEIDEIHKIGVKQEAGKFSRAQAPPEDVRAMEEYHIGQMIETLAFDLDRYAHLITDMDAVTPLPKVPESEAAELFKFKDDGAVRAYNQVTLKLSSAKTSVSTTVNGAESKRNGDLLAIGSYTAPPCGSPAPGTPDGPPLVDKITLKKKWRELSGRKVFVKVENRYIAVSEVTVDELIELFPGGVPIEDPSACVDPHCPCMRHATADPSTNLSGYQTPSLGRLLTITRSESTEGLNLKGKKTGTDGTDSISKHRDFDFMKKGERDEEQAQNIFDAEGMPAVRVWLAKKMLQSYRDLQYTTQMSLDDFTNVAQILVRPIETEAGTRINILAIGELEDLAKEAINRAWAASKDGLAMEEQLAETLKALDSLEYEDGLDIEEIFAGMNVAGQTKNDGLQPGIEARRNASMQRNVDMLNQIMIENPEIKPHSPEVLDKLEAGLKADKAIAAVFDRWPKYLMGKTPFGWKPGKPRDTYRLVGGLLQTGPAFGRKAAGFANAWVIDIRNPNAALGIATAYKLGLTTLLEGSLPEAEANALWKDVYKQTGGSVDANQVVNISGYRGMLSMFDIRLNGGNTVIDNGAMNAGVVHNPGTNIEFIYENPLNELDLGDGEFAASRSFAEKTQVNITGEHKIPARIAFAQMFDAIGTPEQADLDVRGFFNDYRWLSNFYGAEGKQPSLSIELDGIIYPSVENAYQAAKTLDPAERVPFETYTAKQAQKEGQTLPKRPGWEKLKFSIMGGLVRQKFAPGSDLAAALLETGDGYLEERTPWPNKIWGVGPGGGQNRLGLGLMKVRDEIRPPDYVPRNVEGRDNVEVRCPTIEETLNDIIDLYVKDTTPDAPDEFDRITFIDTGVDRIEGSMEDIQLREGIRRFVSRRHELRPDGFLPTGRPGEIVGWLRAKNGNDVRYFPVRPFEDGHDAGAPTLLEIGKIQYDTDTEELIINWEHTGSMLNRSFKLLESGRASNKTMARSKAYPDMVMKDGTIAAGQVHQLSTTSRRLDERMKDKMEAVVYKARLDPWGFSLAERTDTFLNNPELKAGLLDSYATISQWRELLDPKGDASFDGEIDFFPPSMETMNAFCNDTAKKAIRYGINPTVVFASRYDTPDQKGVPSDNWYPFRILFSDGPVYLESFMNFWNLVIPKFMPKQDYTGTGEFSDGDQDTFFNKDLQVLMPFDYVDADGVRQVGEQWVDIFGGPHFLDEHFSGRSGAGTTVSNDSAAVMDTAGYGGRKLSKKAAALHAGWRGLDSYMMPSGLRAESNDD